jgi:hypothetical protein
MITRYDKRKSVIENAAGRSIRYGGEDRPLPWVPGAPPKSDDSGESGQN